jgi:hypothetical protein
MKRFLRQVLLWIAGIVATLLVLLLIFYAEENWRGARDWAACQKELQAKGETLDLRQLAPPGKPEDDLSKVPIFAEMYQAEREYQKTKKFRDDLRIYQLTVDLNPKPYLGPPKTVNYFKGELIDLAAWQKYYRSIPEIRLPKQVGTPAQDVLQALSQFDSELNEIDAAVSNPNAYWPINYERPFDGYLGGITRMISIARVIQLKGVAHLDNHEIDLAEKDYLFSFRLNHPLTKGCFLVNYLVIAGVRTLDDSILWEGLHRHAWNDAQLREMESALASTDLLALAQTSLRVERTAAVRSMQVFQGMDTDIVWKAKVSEDSALALLLATAPIRPSGWWDQDRRALCQKVQINIDAIHPDLGTLSPSLFPFHDMSDSWGWNRANDIPFWDAIYIPMASESVAWRDNFGVKIAKAETYRRLARLACRLEEYRLAHGGQYPDKLDDLPDLPAHLNQEVLSKEPLRYQRKGDGYLLYSIGWNSKDDGGVRATDDTQGDWPWPSP